MAEIYQIPEGNGGGFSPQFTIPLGNGGNGFGFGNGQMNLMDLLGFAIVASIFPNIFGGNNPRGGGFGGGINGDLAMQAIVSQGEASRTAIQTLATSIGQDFNIVNGAVQNIQNSLNAIGAAQGMNMLQVINAIQAGNTAISAQLAQCCCENRTTAIQQGYEAQIRTLEQTNQLSSQADRNANALMAAINNQTVEMDNQFCALKEREMQAKIDAQAEIITQLRGQIDNANQTAQITSYVNALLTPLQAKVDQIASKQLPTVNVQLPQLTAVNTTPYMGAVGYGNGFGNGSIVF